MGQVSIFSFVGKCTDAYHPTQSNSDWLFITLLRVFQVSWMMVDKSENQLYTSTCPKIVWLVYISYDFPPDRLQLVK